MSVFQIEVNCYVEHNKYEWRKMKPTNGPAYCYTTREEAEKVARMCYPEHQDSVRVVQTN